MIISACVGFSSLNLSIDYKQRSHTSRDPFDMRLTVKRIVEQNAHFM